MELEMDLPTSQIQFQIHAGPLLSKRISSIIARRGIFARSCRSNVDIMHL